MNYNIGILWLSFALCLCNASGESVADADSSLESLKRFGFDIFRDSDNSNGIRVVVQGSGSRFDDESLKVLANFEDINALLLLSSKVTDKGVEALASIRGLLSLNLRNSSVTGAAFAKWRASELKYLILSGCPVTDESLNIICGVPSLKTLNLSRTRISNKDIKSIARLEQLEGLWLGKTAITDEALKNVGKMKHLQFLSLAGANVTDAGIEHCSGLFIETLDIANTKVTDKVLPSLFKMRQLKRIAVSGTAISKEARKRIVEPPFSIEIVD